MISPATRAQIVAPIDSRQSVILAEAFLPAPIPSDVLNPDRRRNSPFWKIAVRAGLNRSNYSNDRYFDNTQLDVGQVSGEGDIYESAAGFGYGGGIELEYPINTGISLCFDGEFDHVVFSGSGPVQEPCVNGAGESHMSTSLHEFDVAIDYVKVAATAKLSLSNWYVMMGLSAGHPISTSLTRTRSFGDSDCFFPNSNGQQVIAENGEIPKPTSLHYAFRMGFGLIYQLSKRLQFSPELMLDFGMSPINKSHQSDLGVYSIRAVLRLDI